jgi:hypothetical protein
MPTIHLLNGYVGRRHVFVRRELTEKHATSKIRVTNLLHKQQQEEIYDIETHDSIIWIRSVSFSGSTTPI